MELRMTASMTFAIGPNVELRPTASELERLMRLGLSPPFKVDQVDAMWEDQVLITADGQTLGSALEVLASRGCTNEVGKTEVNFSPPVYVDLLGEAVLVDSLVWAIESATTSFPIVAGRGLGEPRLVAIDVARETYNRAIFDRSLKRLGIASNGQVVDQVRVPVVEAELRRLANEASDDHIDVET